MTDYKQFKISEVFAALERNGLKHIRERWFAEDVEGIVIGACILGQTAINLGVEANQSEGSLLHHLDTFKVTDKDLWGGYHSPYYENSEDGLNEKNGFIPAGSLIMHWNDVTEYGDNGFQYVLKTYEEVVEKARVILTPFFDETITLRTRVWQFERKEA